MSKYYILYGHTPVPCDVMTLGLMSKDDFLSRIRTGHRVAKSGEEGKIWVSTVFLGLDHSFEKGEPQLFETMIFGVDGDEYQTRCATWEQAEEMHRIACEHAGVKP